MGKFINPFTDFGFKHIFGREMDKDILIEFLNDLLEGEHTIMDLRIMNNERLPETEQGRKVIFDIHCETDKGERIIIEMQNREQPHFKDRALYYLSHSVVEQGIKGTWDYELAAVYGVFFLNFTLDEENRPNNNRNEGKFRRDIVLADRENGQVFNPKFRQIYIELPRFNKEEEECETDFERWIYVLKHMDTLDRMPFKARKAIFERLERIGSMANLTPKQRAQYEAEWKMYNDYYNTLDFAVEKGMKKGMEKVIAGRTDVTEKRSQGNIKSEKLTETIEKRKKTEDVSEGFGETVVLSSGVVKGPATLVSREPGELATIYLEQDITVIGKLETAADVVISIPTVSRIHAKIRKRDGEYYLTDLNSRNGTSVNGQMLKTGEDYLLKDEDEVDFSQARYIFLK